MESSAASRLQTVIDKIFDGNNRALAGAIGVHESQISRWVNEKNAISDITAKKFEPIGINPAWILFGDGDFYAANHEGDELRSHFGIQKDEKPEDVDSESKYRFYRNPVGAGSNPDFDAAFDTVNFDELLHLNSSTYIAPVVGEQFAEFDVHSGDLIVVEKTQFYKDYALLIIKKGDSIYLKRYRKFAGKEFLNSENPENPPELITDGIEIIGMITALIKKM